MASIISHNPRETEALGRALAAGLRPGDVLALCGDLGAGKTHLVKGLAAGLGISQEITSPTFTLVHEHRDGRLPLYHIDLYRLESARELEPMEEYLHGDGVTVVEWADKFPEFFKHARWVRIHLRDGEEREISIA